SRGSARSAARRHRAVVARVRQPRHVPRLHASRRRVHRGSEGARRMNSSASSMTFARSGSRGATVHIDTVTLGVVLAIVLLGLVMVTSASISIANKETGDVFFYLERQLILTIVGCAAAAFVFCLPTRLLERISTPLLIAAVVLLLMVFIPGLGHVVNGSRRWIRLGFLNFQVSELTRVFVLIYVASYAARRSEELRTSFMG